MNFFSLKTFWWTSLALHLYAAWHSVGFQHCDEHFQILEPLAGNTAPWEFSARIRPWFQTTVFKIFLWPWEALGLKDPFTKMMLLRVICSLLGFFSLNRLASWWQQRHPQSDPVWTYALIHLAWFVPYLHARTSSENVATSLFLLSLTLFEKEKVRGWKGLLAGALGGCAFWARFHLGIPVFLLWCAALWRRRWNNANWAFPLGVVLVVCAGVGLDSWWYGEWTLSPYRYFTVNIIQDKASSFGVDPWYKYLEWGFFKLLPPLSLILLGSLLWYWFKRPSCVLSLLGFSFFLVHSLIPHKEARFLFPLLPLAQLAVIYFFPRPPSMDSLAKKAFLYLCLLINTVALIVSTNKHANSLILIQQQLYRRGIESLAAFPSKVDFANPYYVCKLDVKLTNPHDRDVLAFDQTATSPPREHVLFYHYGREKLFPWIRDCQLLWQNRSDLWGHLLPEKQLHRSSFIKLYHCPLAVEKTP